MTYSFYILHFRVPHECWKMTFKLICLPLKLSLRLHDLRLSYGQLGKNKDPIAMAYFSSKIMYIGKSVSLYFTEE